MAEKDLNVGYLFDFYGELLSERQKEMLDLYYNDDLSLSEVAEQVGITRQGVRDTVKKTAEQLVNFENRLGLAGRFNTISEKSSKIIAALEQIKCESESDTEKLKVIISEVSKLAEL